MSTVGIAACAQANGLAVGVGYNWGGSVNPMIGSCNLTAYQTAVAPSLARDARSSRAPVSYPLIVPAGLSNEMIKLAGRGGAPDVTITGPGAVHASSAGQASAQQGPFVIKRATQLNTTYIAIIHPRAGRYTIRLNPGSPAIAEVLDAHGFTPRLRAHVTGSHRRRQLVYSVNMQPGEKVTFTERGRDIEHLLGTTHKSRGTLDFTAAPGPGGPRQIIATATDNGYPVVLHPGSPTAGALVLASYQAPGPQRLPRVRGLRARRAGSRLLVSFDRVPAAKRYAVVITLRDGLRTDYVTSRNSLQITVPTTAPLGGTVTACALGNDLTTNTGPATSAKIKVPPPPHGHSRHHHRR